MAEPDEKSKPAAPDSNPLDGMLGFFNSALAFLANTNPADEGGVTVTSELGTVSRGAASGVDPSQDFDAIHLRLQALEDVAGVGPPAANGVASRDLGGQSEGGGPVSPMKQAVPDPLLDALFEGVGAPAHTADAPAGSEKPSGAAEGKEAGDIDEEDVESVHEPSILDKLKAIPNPCTKYWGGPFQATNQDNLWTFFERWVGHQGAGAINHFFDDGGILRKLFWFGLFLAGGYMGAFYCISAIFEFLNKGIITSTDVVDHGGELPQMSVCMSSPIRCSCEAFYDDNVLAKNFKKVMPYLCLEALVFTDTNDADNIAPDLAGIDSKGERVAYSVYTKAGLMVHKQKTLDRVAALKEAGTLRTSDCDSGDYTKDWFINKVETGVMSYMDLIMYAGYTRRTQIVKECMVLDSEEGSKTVGEKISCMGKEWWSPMWVDANHGACYTMNPCVGLPVGNKCEEDSDCQHSLNKKSFSGADSELPKFAQVGGGYCDQDVGKCKCSSCEQGKDCRQVVQTRAGVGNGVRLMLNAAVEEDTPVTSAENNRWSPGVLVHMHTAFDKGLLSEALVVPPGQVMDVAVQKNMYSELAYAFTNCSDTFNIDPSVCRTNCLRRTQAIKCCGNMGVTMKDNNMTKGKFFKQVNYTDPKNNPVAIGDPVLACNVLKDGFRKCIAEQQMKFQDGEICLDGALSFAEPFVFAIFTNAKPNSYDDQAGMDEGISGMERRSMGIINHCVWAENQNAGAEAFNTARLGKECTDDTDCKTSLGDDGTDGKCLEAYRAYCPQRCKREGYAPATVSTASMSKNTAKLIANRELAFVTKQQSITLSNPALKGWKPFCVKNPTYASVAQDAADPVNASNASVAQDAADPASWKYKGIEYKTPGQNGTSLAGNEHCMTEEEGVAKVRADYGIANLHYLNFEAHTHAKEEAMPITELLGVLGGNLGLFLGFTMMTFIEWFEMLFFFAGSALFLILRLPILNFLFVRSVPAEVTEEDVYEDEDVLHVLRNVKKIADQRKEAAEVSGGNFGNFGSGNETEPHIYDRNDAQLSYCSIEAAM